MNSTYTHVTIESAESELGDGPYWIAHDHPERPADKWVLWDWGCDACYIHLEATVRLDVPLGALRSVSTEGGPPIIERHSNQAMLVAVTEWRREQGLRVRS